MYNTMPFLPSVSAVGIRNESEAQTGKKENSWEVEELK